MGTYSLHRGIFILIFSLFVIGIPFGNLHAADHKFAYLDLELLSATLASESDVHSGFYIDIVINRSVIHGGVIAGYVGAEYIIAEVGYSYAFSMEYDPEAPTSQLIYKGQDYMYKYYEENYFYDKALKLKCIDVGVKILNDFYVFRTDVELEDEVFGELYDNIDEVEYFANDKVIYFGYRVLSFRDALMTQQEYMLHVHGFLGLTDRHAVIWNEAYYDDTEYREVEDDGELKLGAEVGIRWNLFQGRLGFYDSWFYFNIGFRLGFDLGNIAS
jgi:hypothetical protein